MTFEYTSDGLITSDWIVGYLPGGKVQWRAGRAGEQYIIRESRLTPVPEWMRGECEGRESGL
jgi:hypothetical protein